MSRLSGNAQPVDYAVASVETMMRAFAAADLPPRNHFAIASSASDDSIHEARQSSSPSPTAKRAGPPNAVGVPSPSHTRTRHEYGRPGSRAGPA